MPLDSQFRRRNTLSSVALNTLGDMVDDERVAFFVQVDCLSAVGVDVLQEFYVYNFYRLFWKLACLLQFALGGMLIRTRRTRCRAGYVILGREIFCITYEAFTYFCQRETKLL